ncbi:MAG TPA: hypothetical protein VNI02_21065 [Blastocatellia bacterium]|jgi:hypothetical protein|nr:hypothetical protein [Blastocatellia bacterium]
MLIIIAATVIALCLTSLLILKGPKTDHSHLSEPRATIPTMGVQIICGDCSGDALSPYKTYLDHNGNCQQCGGHSYELASTLAVHALQVRAARMAESQSAPSSGRVIPFEVPARSARSEKIAV